MATTPSTRVIGTGQEGTGDTFELNEQRLQSRQTTPQPATELERQPSPHSDPHGEPNQDSLQQNVPQPSTPPQGLDERSTNLQSNTSGSDSLHGAQVSSQGTWSSGQQLLQVVPSTAFMNLKPPSSLVGNVTATSTIVASIVSIATLGITVWQVLDQKSHGSGGSSDDGTDSGKRKATLAKDTGQTNEVPIESTTSLWRSAQTVAIAIVGFLACLALAFSVCATLVALKRRTSERRPSDIAMAAFTQLGHHTKHHARRAHSLVRSYHISLQQVGIDQFRFWASPIRTAEMMKQSIEDEDEDNQSIRSEPSTASDTDNDGESFQGDIRRADTEQDSDSEISPEVFKLTDTHLTPRSVLDLGKEELRRRFRKRGELIRKKTDSP